MEHLSVPYLLCEYAFTIKINKSNTATTILPEATVLPVYKPGPLTSACASSTERWICFGIETSKTTENEILMRILIEKSEIQTWTCLFLTSLKRWFFSVTPRKYMQTRVSPDTHSNPSRQSKYSKEKKKNKTDGTTNCNLRSALCSLSKRSF